MLTTLSHRPLCLSCLPHHFLFGAISRWRQSFTSRSGHRITFDTSFSRSLLLPASFIIPGYVLHCLLEKLKLNLGSVALLIKGVDSTVAQIVQVVEFHLSVRLVSALYVATRQFKLFCRIFKVVKSLPVHMHSLWKGTPSRNLGSRPVIDFPLRFRLLRLNLSTVMIQIGLTQFDPAVLPHRSSRIVVHA
jgi:hypothetical protein